MKHCENCGIVISGNEYGSGRFCSKRCAHSYAANKTNKNRPISYICEKCGKIIDVFESVEPPCKLNEHGVSVTSSKAVFYGVCADCNKKQN